MDSGLYDINSYQFSSFEPYTSTQRYDIENYNLGYGQNPMSTNLFCEACGAEDHDKTCCRATFGEILAWNSRPSNQSWETTPHSPLQAESHQSTQENKLDDFIKRHDRDVDKILALFPPIMEILNPLLTQFNSLSGLVDSLKTQVDDLTNENQMLKDQIAELVISNLPIEPSEVHYFAQCTSILIGVEKKLDEPHFDRNEFIQETKEDPMIDELNVLQSSIPTPTIIPSCEEEAISETKGRHRRNKRKRCSVEHAPSEFKQGDHVILYHHKSSMFPGSKSTRWSGPYNLNRVLPNDSVELWHKNSGYFLVRKIRLKPYIEPDPIKLGITDPPDPST